MLFSTLSTAMTALAMVSTAGAIPTWGRPVPRADPKVAELLKLMPSSALPKPVGQLKYVVLGLGTQNYTCLSGSDTAVPDTTGATAVLFDLGTALSKDRYAQFKIGSLSGLALSFHSKPKLLESYFASVQYPKAGNHFFTDKTPTFSLQNIRVANNQPFPLAMVKKNLDTDAPPTACRGTTGEGAVKWLHLIDAGTSKGGVDTVYRIETAGGNKPATCKGQKKTFEVPYAAQYWVFGPA
ncbi:hypothetical protein BDV95DRAFT_594669 [Massariosphaeria phaeospora]|uniref:Malate dehydrogenase n=1 Tax=Massariosphaeria phaeospora TaxID=100035 RepID=A0A7C8MBW1_9PLEO|nr:hypothetical protein BDV95DRAFT_594669 [Massariosphaeria phaeospora]